MRHPSAHMPFVLARCFRIAGPVLLASMIALAGAAAGSDVAEFRSIDGAGNNLANPDWGSAGATLLRRAPSAYADGSSAPAGTHRPGAREISNALFAQDGDIPAATYPSSMVWMWGQFLDHDISLSGPAQPAESFDIPVPAGDPTFDPFNTGTMVLPFLRTVHTTTAPVRQQINQITSFIDGSSVYGSDTARAQALRRLDGSGRLATSAGDLLPFNSGGLPNEPTARDPGLFIAGDVRANEQVGLTALHTLFVREHNYQAERLRRPGMSGDDIYQRARAIVGAELQVITYNEFLPAVLGDRALPRYRGYHPDVNPGVANIFSSAAYRFGHSMLPPALLRLGADLEPIAAGELALIDAFFNPRELIDNGGIEPLLRGASMQVAQQVDAKLVGAVRNMLFGMPGTIGSGTDLASLNIQRGRDHGLADYNSTRVALGLPPARSVNDISSDPDTQLQLLLLYPNVDDIDLWVGGIAEDHVDGALVGETFWHIIHDQFIALRGGDRFWYEIHLDGRELSRVKQTRLIDIIRRNTSIGGEVAGNLWMVDGRNGSRR